MSWTYDFGVVEDAEDLLAHEPQLDLPFDVDRNAVNDHIKAVKKSVLALLSETNFDNCAVRVIASGSALPGHKPWPGRVEKRTVEKYGQTFETEAVLDPAAVEGITITVTQVPPADLKPKGADSDTT